MIDIYINFVQSAKRFIENIEDDNYWAEFRRDTNKAKKLLEAERNTQATIMWTKMCEYYIGNINYNDVIISNIALKIKSILSTFTEESDFKQKEIIKTIIALNIEKINNPDLTLSKYLEELERELIHNPTGNKKEIMDMVSKKHPEIKQCEKNKSKKNSK